MKTKIKKMLLYVLIAFLGILTFAVFSNYLIIEKTRNQTFSTIENLPQNNVGLVLGTIKNLGIYDNPYYTFRLKAAAKLYQEGKVKHLILSGDNSRKGYDEPTDMKTDLLKMGIPESAITLDYAGFRTLDSVVRCNEIFGQDQFTIISQEFHNQRAVFLAQQFDLEVVAYNAKSPFLPKKMRLREFFAKTKAILDIFILNKKPKFLGKKIEINLD